MAEASEQEPVNVPLVWVGVEDVPVYAANQMIVQHTPQGEFVISFGQLQIPVLMGTEEQRAEQVKDIRYVQVTPVARLGMNRQRVEEVIQALQTNLGQYDKTVGEMPND